jgi:cupin superfamily protein
VPDPAPALARCVAVGLEDFVRETYGRGPRLTTVADFAAAGHKPGYDDLLSIDGLDELLAERGLRTPFLRVAQDGAVIPAHRYTGGGGLGAEISDQVRDDRIVELLAGGATLVFQGLHRTWPSLIRFTAGLAEELGCAVQANAYLTPPSSQGFATHYDTHDVFVLQVAGRKRWRIHAPVLPDPLEHQPWGGRADEVRATADGAPVLDAILGPGDALYLPRGWLHAAVAESETSLHLTLGLRRPTRHCIVEALAALAAADPALRTGFGPGTDLTDPAQLGPELAATVAALTRWLATVEAADVARRLRGDLWPARRPVPVGPLAQLASLRNLEPETRLVRRQGLRWHLSDNVTSGATRLELTDRVLEFPASCTTAVRAALSGRALRVDELPGLDNADRLVLARRLLRESVLVPVRPA